MTYDEILNPYTAKYAFSNFIYVCDLPYLVTL